MAVYTLPGDTHGATKRDVDLELARRARFGLPDEPSLGWSDLWSAWVKRTGALVTPAASGVIVTVGVAISPPASGEALGNPPQSQEFLDGRFAEKLAERALSHMGEGGGPPTVPLSGPRSSMSAPVEGNWFG